MHNRVAAGLVALLFLSACNGAGNAGVGDSSNANKSTSTTTPQVNVNQINASVTNAQTALQQAESAVGSIFNADGTINWSVLTDGVNFQGMSSTTQACLQAAFPNQGAAMVFMLPTDIGTALQCVFTDVVAVAGIASSDLSNALTVLNAGLAQATPGSPDYVQIQAMITEVETLKTNYTTMIHSLAGQLTLVNTFLATTLPTLATSAIPIPILSMLGGFLVAEYLAPIETEITQFQSQLDAL